MTPDDNSRWKNRSLSIIALVLVYLGAIVVFSPAATADGHEHFDSASFTKFNCGAQWGPNEESDFSASPGTDHVAVQGDVRTEHLGEGYGDTVYYGINQDVVETSDAWEFRINITTGDSRDEDPQPCQANFEGEVINLPTGEQRIRIIVQSDDADDNRREYQETVDVPESDSGGGTEVGCDDSDNDGYCNQDDRCTDYDGDGYGRNHSDKECTADYCSDVDGENNFCQGEDQCPNDDTGHIMVDGECYFNPPDDTGEEDPEPTNPNGQDGNQGLHNAMQGMPLLQKITIGVGSVAAGYFADDLMDTDPEEVSFMQRLNVGTDAKDLLCSITSLVPGGKQCRGGPLGGILGGAAQLAQNKCRQAAGTYREYRQTTQQQMVQLINSCSSQQVFDVAQRRCINVNAEIEDPDGLPAGPTRDKAYPLASLCKSQGMLYNSNSDACVNRQEFLNSLPGPSSGDIPSRCGGSYY